MAVKIAKDQCVGCESCIATCPAGALVMKDGKAEVKEDSCISCGACVSECPVQAISLPKAEREVANKEGCDLWVMAETDAGQIIAPGVWPAGAINHTDYPEQAYLLGKRV